MTNQTASELKPINLLEKKAEVIAASMEGTWRTFCYVKEPNTRIQIVEAHPDTPENKPLQSIEGIIHKTTRIGDKFVEFVDGLCTSNDPDVIAWCESMYPDVLDMESAESELLVPMARMQVARADYEPEVTSIDLVRKSSASIQKTIRDAVLMELKKRGIDPDEEVVGEAGK